MKILIPDIPKVGVDVDINESFASNDALVAVKGRITIQKTGSEVMVEGNLNAIADLNCSRCLKKFTEVVTIPVAVVYHPIEELAGDDNYEVTSGELDLDFYTGDELDITRLLIEQVELNTPMKPLCSEFCRGLCPNCGEDMNLSSCSCILKDSDPRFLKLKNFLKERKE